MILASYGQWPVYSRIRLSIDCCTRNPAPSRKDTTIIPFVRHPRANCHAQTWFTAKDEFWQSIRFRTYRPVQKINKWDSCQLIRTSYAFSVFLSIGSFHTAHRRTYWPKMDLSASLSSLQPSLDTYRSCTCRQPLIIPDKGSGGTVSQDECRTSPTSSTVSVSCCLFLCRFLRCRICQCR